jgi:hypothetical protein
VSYSIIIHKITKDGSKELAETRKPQHGMIAPDDIWARPPLCVCFENGIDKVFISLFLLFLK